MGVRRVHTSTIFYSLLANIITSREMRGVDMAGRRKLEGHRLTCKILMDNEIYDTTCPRGPVSGSGLFVVLGAKQYVRTLTSVRDGGCGLGIV